MIRTALPVALVLSQWFSRIDAHGYMSSPRSRSYVARQDGTEFNPRSGVPSIDYCWHCLNTNSGTCGMTNANNYDDWVDSLGSPMPWKSEITYAPGQLIQMDFEITAHHWGHVELKACAMGRDSSQECLDANPLEFVSDIRHQMPKDPNYPERGYLAGNQVHFSMTFLLPSDVKGDEVLLQWRYITANSCTPPGYNNYFNGDNDAGTTLPSSFWNSALNECNLPYPSDGSRDRGGPEQFWNCAEVSILDVGDAALPVEPPFSPPVATPIAPPASHPMEPPADPPTTQPVSSPTSPLAPPVEPPVTSPVQSPSDPGDGCCSMNFKTCIDWCGSTKADCLACDSSVTWLPNGSIAVSTCQARYQRCNSVRNSTPGLVCCPGLVCEYKNDWYAQCRNPSSS